MQKYTSVHEVINQGVLLMEYQIHNNLTLGCHVDSQGDIEVIIPNYCLRDESTTYIGRDDAIKIIEHLKNVFGI